MQNIQTNPSVRIPVETAFGRYSARQRFLSASLSLAVTSSVSASVSMTVAASAAQAHERPSLPFAGGGSWGQHVPGGNAFAQAAASQAATPAALPQSLVNHGAFGVSHAALNAAAHHSASQAATLSPAWHAAHSAVQALANQTAAAHDINLNSAAALYAAGGLAGFHDLTLDIGGKQVQVSGDTKLTGAELVAAQQVLADGGQDIHLNARGVATGGVFDMNAAAISAISDAVGGSIKSLYISRGVQAIDSLANLNLLGNLVNMGSLVVGAAPNAANQTVDSIYAANIYNGWGGSISSTSAVLSGLNPTDISLIATGVFFNAGNVSSAGNLNITAASITNTYAGLAVPTAATVPVLSAAQNVNLYTSALNNNGLIASGADINIFNNTTANLIAANAGGTLQALNGNINFNAPDYNGAQGILATGGNWFSQQLNFNAGTGSIDANINEVTGLINGTGSSSHITVSTANMNLGDICISGDPTYFNANGDVTITGNLTGNPDLAIVASRNIIANGGSLDTSSTTGNGGTLTLIAGANFTTDGPLSNSNDTKTTLTIQDSVNPGLGSKTGGYIDLSGSFVTGNAKNAALSAITTNSTVGTGGDVLMVAYAGTGLKSGSIVSSAIPGETGAAAVDATGAKGGGDITILGAGPFLYGQNLYGGNIQILGGTPHISGGSGAIKIFNGTVLPTGASFSQFGATASDINVMTVVGDNVTMKTGGFISTDVIVASGLGGAVNGKGADGGNVNLTGSALFLSGVEATGGGGGGGNASTDGGAGGNGGNIMLNSSGPIIIEDFSPAPGYLNVSGGGGGGGGGGGSATGAAGKGGAGGKAGTVTINTNSLFFAGGVLAADGAAGGDGGAGVVGTAGGGGGGGGGAFGGGGGGGAAGADATGTGSAVGGGGGAGFYEGGGGGAGATGKAVVTAGTGGSATGQFNPTPGLGGTIVSPTGMAGTDGSANAGGAGGIPTGSGLSGGAGGKNGGATFGIGGGSDANAGQDGKEISTVTGNGVVNISVGAASGSLAQPIGTATPTLNVTGTTKSSALFLSGFSDYTEITSAKFAGGTLNVLGGNGLTVAGAISGADNVQLGAFGKLDVKNTVSATNVSLQSFNSIPTVFDGDINVGVGGLVLATNGTLTAENNIIANTQVNTLAAAAGGTSVTINEAATSSKALNLLGSFVGSGGTFTVNSAQQINVTKGITAFNGTINLNETGTLSKIGINITSALTLVEPFKGVTGTVNLSTTGGNASIINSVPITAIDLNINADGAVGSSAKAFATNITGTITVNGNSHDLIAIKDANLNAPTLTGKSTVFGQGISFVSAAKNLSVGNLGYTNVTLSNTFATAGGGATVTLNPTGNVANVIGDGFGTVSITTAAAEIDQGKTVTVPVISAKSLVLKSNAADVGGAGLGLNVSASTITASAAKGSVSIQDGISAGLSAGSALKNYNVSADGLTVVGAITGDVITLTGTGSSAVVLNGNVGTTKSTNVNVTGGSGITQNNKAVATGVTVNLKAATTGDIGTAGQSILTKAGTTLTINGSNNSQVFVKQTGSVAVGSSLAAGASVLNLTGTGNLNIKGSISYGAINLTAPVVEVFSGGSLGTINGLTVTAPVAKFDSGSSSIISGGATFNSASALAISGSDAALTVVGALTLGGTVGGKQTTSITLGDAKTGANNPLATELNKTLSAITVNTKGNFTGSLQTIATDDSTLGGKIDITAAKIVNVNAVPSLAPIVISANATAGAAGKVFLNLTGTQAVTLGTATVGKGDPQITISTSGGAGAGTISVSSAGLLTVDNGGVVQTGANRNLTLIGAKGLSVTDINLLKTNLNSLTLSSGSTTPFTIGEGAVPVNGTAGDIVALSVDVNAAGGIVLAKTHTMAATIGSSFSNDTGSLTITGDDNSISAGTALTLSAKGAISLGDVKNGGINNPLNDLGNEKLDFLSITAGGNFSGNYPVIALNPVGGTMNISVANIVNVGSTPLAPIQIKAENTAGLGGSVILNLTGTQVITLGNNSVISGQPQIQISVDGVGGGFVDVKTAGVLTVNNGGVKFGSGAHDLSLNGGKGLSVTDTTLLNTNLASVSLTSGGTTPFVVGAAPASKDLLNGTASDIKAGTVSVTALKGITVSAASAITASGAGGSLSLDTTSLLNNGTISGKDAGSTLLFSDPGKSNLGISALGTGIYQNFGDVVFNTDGNVDLGNLFTPGKLASGLNSIVIQAGGSVTFASFLPTLNVAPGGTISVHAASLATKATTPIDFVATGTATIDISTKSALTLGASKGTVALTVDPTGSTVSLVSTGGTLTVDTALSAGTITLNGSSVVVKQVVTAGTADLTVLAVGKTGTVTTVGSGLLVNAVGDVNLGQGSTKLAATPILINAANVVLGDGAATGALNVSNSSGSFSAVSGAVPIAALSYSSLKDTSVGSISTTAGALTVSTRGSLSTGTGVKLSSVGGGISLITSTDPGNTIVIGKNNTLTASSGSILIQNNNVVNGTITILAGVNILGSGTAKGVGQVSIVMGALPAANTLQTGVIPANTTIKSTGGAGVFFGSLAFPNDSIAANGSNILFAEGRNVVFATRGLGASTITINGGTITADPPAGAASSMSAATVTTSTSSISSTPLASGELQIAVASAMPALEATSQITPLPALTSALAASAQRFASMPGSLYAGYGPGSAAASSNVTNYGVGAGSPGQGERRLERGAVLLSSDETTTVQTTFGSVTAQPGALALLVAFDGGVAVYNLHDDKKDAVVIRCGNRRVSVGPGRNTVITNRTGAKFEAVNPAHFVGYRRMSENDYGQGIKAFHSEFNTYSLMRGVDAIKKLIASDNPKQRKIASSMLKTSAILLGLGNDQQFKLMLPPQMTAMIGNNTVASLFLDTMRIDLTSPDCL